MQINHYLNNQLVNPPENWEAFEIELNFDRDKTTARDRLTVTNLIWCNENNDTIVKWLADGQTTGVGIGEGIPYKMELIDGATTEIPFDGFLDTMNEAKYSRIKSTLKARELKTVDWLNEVADGFSFEYLFQQNIITNNDFVFVPYVLNTVPNYLQSAISLLTIYYVEEAIRKTILEIVQLSTSLANVFEATAIVRLVFEVVYLIALIISIIKMIKDMIMFLIQPVKYHACMSYKKLLEAGSNYLGLTFKSDIFNVAPFQDMYFIPNKQFIPPNSIDDRIFGFTTPNQTKQNGYPKGNLGQFGEFLRHCKKLFCAKLEIRKNISTGNDELHMLRDDQNLSTPQYQLRDIQNFDFETNASEFLSNIFINFNVDAATDGNTVNDYKGTTYQAILTPIHTTNPKLVLMKGFLDVEIETALAKRKEDLTTPEKICNFFLTVFNSLINGVVVALNAVINVVNQITHLINTVTNALGIIGIHVHWQIQPIPHIPGVNIGNLISNRIGMMKLEMDFFSVPKSVILQVASQPKNTKIHPQNYIYLSAEYIYNNFYFIKSFLPTPTRPTGNQYIIKNFENVPFTFSDFEKVKDSNYILDAQGNAAEITSLKWNPRLRVAKSMVVRFPTLLTNNLQLTTLIPDGK